MYIARLYKYIENISFYIYTYSISVRIRQVQVYTIQVEEDLCDVDVYIKYKLYICCLYSAVLKPTLLLGGWVWLWFCLVYLCAIQLLYIIYIR